jgi:outer membrane protein TolC
VLQRGSKERGYWTLLIKIFKAKFLYDMKKLVVIFLCLSSFSFAQKEMKLSLQEAIRIALVNNIDIVISDHKIGLAENSLRKRKARRYPKLNLSVNTGYKETIKKNEPWSFELAGSQYTVEPPSEDEWNNNLSLSLNKEIYTAGEISSQIKEAYYQREIAIIEKELAKQELTAKVSRAYWELVKAHLLVKLEEEMVEYSQGILTIVQERLKVESIAPIEVEKAEAELKNSKYNLAVSKEEAKEKEIDLAFLLNINDRTIIPIDEPEREPLKIGLEEAMKEGLKLRLDIKKSLMDIEAKNSALKVARSMLYPKVNLSARYNFDGSNRDYLESLKDIEPSSWDIGLILSWPFYDRTIKEDISEKEKGLTIAKNILKKKEEDIIYEIKKAYCALEKAKEKISYCDVSFAEKNLKISQLEYELGKITFNELLSSQLKLKEARYKEISARIDERIAQAEFIRLTGVPK